MKTIKAFRQEPYGLFIDLVDAEASVAIDRKSGTMTLDEGDGNDRFYGAFLDPADVRSLVVKPLSGSSNCAIVLRYAKQREHILGETPDTVAALEWVNAANELLESKVIRNTTQSSTPPQNAKHLHGMETTSEADLVVRK